MLDAENLSLSVTLTIHFCLSDQWPDTQYRNFLHLVFWRSYIVVGISVVDHVQSYLHWSRRNTSLSTRFHLERHTRKEITKFHFVRLAHLNIRREQVHWSVCVHEHSGSTFPGQRESLRHFGSDLGLALDVGHVNNCRRDWTLLLRAVLGLF